jgi:hypothetical protein
MSQNPAEAYRNNPTETGLNADFKEGFLWQEKLESLLDKVDHSGDPYERIHDLLFFAIGASSLAWSPKPEGVFDSTLAGNIGRGAWYAICDVLKEKFVSKASSDQATPQTEDEPF